MADEKSTSQNQQDDQRQEKAMGATANAGTQGQDRQQNSPSETAGQGGGIQGSGQSQPNPGGYTGVQEQNRDDSPSNQGSDRRPDPTQGE